jgi:hypothetical protein
MISLINPRSPLGKKIHDPIAVILFAPTTISRSHDLMSDHRRCPFSPPTPPCSRIPSLCLRRHAGRHHAPIVDAPSLKTAGHNPIVPATATASVTYAAARRLRDLRPCTRRPSDPRPQIPTSHPSPARRLRSISCT